MICKKHAFLILFILPGFIVGCDITKHVPEGQYLLRKNSISLKTDKGITRRGEMKDQLQALTIQKPNKRELGIFPLKLWVYNARYNKYKNDTIKLRNLEHPVIYDSTLQHRSAENMKSYLFNQGYFYAIVDDTVKFNRKKARVKYNVTTGTNYLINNLSLDVDDSLVLQYVKASMPLTELKKNTEFSYTLLEEERSRIASVLRNKGYFKFSQDNIFFVLDTAKGLSKATENIFESAIDLVTFHRQKKKQTLDIKIIIRAGDDPSAYTRYIIGKISVFPDFVDRTDLRDSSMTEKIINDVVFRYHRYYVRENVILKHIYLIKGEFYSQDNYDLTITKLNELNIFQYVRLYIVEDTSVHDAKTLRCVVLLNPASRFDFVTNFEVSNGSTYSLGSSVSVSLSHRNLFKGANRLSIIASGGLESGYSSKSGSNIFEHFFLLSKNYGVNANIIFPKFIAPISQSNVSRRNLPRTILGIGTNWLARTDYFTLSSTTANFTYNWHETSTRTWDVSPAFINILRLPYESDSFINVLKVNEFLTNSYKPNFIEGENITLTFSDQDKPSAIRGYSYVKVSAEEAGGLMSGVNTIGKALNNDFVFSHAQYVKFDLDARHYFNLRNSVVAFRFNAGIGLPYDKSETLPYVKQYFVGGAYSIRGWRIRNLGPGATYPDDTSVNFIDRTGDIKIEASAEYRFPVVQLFSSALKLNGAVFADAGNIWLAKKIANYPNGEFNLSRFGHDIAVSSGIGARLDLGGGLITLRIDGAFALKKPYVQENGGWVIDKIDFGSYNWRNNNIILNFAIGYPF